LNARGILLLVVTHDDEVAARARRHVRMRDGKVVVDQRTATVASPP
jgi:putative ABC transport system ATP-binding protein